MRELQPCGTRAAYKRHLYHGERCEICRLAENERSRIKGKTPNATCSRCGRPTIRSRSSNPEIVCHLCRRAGVLKVERECALPGCDRLFLASPKSRRRFCSQRCGRQGTPGRWGQPGRDPDKVRANNRRKRAARYAVTSDVTAEVERRLRAAAKRCPLCAVRLVDVAFTPASKELDHIVPLCIGGADVIGNVRIICRLCNLRRPKDGSDLDGMQLSLWQDAPMLARRASEPRRRIKLCECGQPLGRSGKSGRCGTCRADRDRWAAVLRAEGWSWAMVAGELGYASTGAAYNAASRAA